MLKRVRCPTYKSLYIVRLTLSLNFIIFLNSVSLSFYVLLHMQVDITKSIYSKLQTEPDSQWYAISEEMCSVCGVIPTTPRVPGSMIPYPNQSSTSPKDFYLSSVYMPLLDYALFELNVLFTGNK